MAVAIARAELGDGVAVESAGTSAVVGWGATREAELVAAEHGLSLAGHRARQLTRELATAADLVVGMEPHHVSTARMLGARRAIAFAEGPIADPYGCGLAVYRQTWAALAGRIPALLDAGAR
jgi:protein-tyrosine phosphatase